MTERNAVSLLALAAVLWSFGGLLIKWVDWHPMAIAGARSAIAAIVILAFVRRPQWTWSKEQIGGAVAYACMVSLFVLANKLTTAANAILLQFTAPVWIVVFSSWYLGERTRLRDLLIVTVVLGGMVLFFLDDLDTGGTLGNACAVASGMAFAWLALFLRKQKRGSPVESVLLGNMITAVIALPFYGDSAPDTRGWIGLLLLGIFQLGLPYILYARAIRHVTALEAVLIPVIEPILNPLWVMLLLGEIPGFWATGGGAIVLLAIGTRGVMYAQERRNSRGNAADLRRKT